jgi:hypothetical protein
MPARRMCSERNVTEMGNVDAHTAQTELCNLGIFRKLKPIEYDNARNAILSEAVFEPCFTDHTSVNLEIRSLCVQSIALAFEIMAQKANLTSETEHNQVCFASVLNRAQKLDFSCKKKQQNKKGKHSE